MGEGEGSEGIISGHSMERLTLVLKADYRVAKIWRKGGGRCSDRLEEKHTAWLPRGFPAAHCQLSARDYCNGFAML